MARPGSPIKPPRACNDNGRNVLPLVRRFAFDIYYAASRARWIGRVMASTEEEATEAAAVDFNADVRNLIAVRAFEIT